MNVIGYVQDSTADGEGLRDVLFVTGCEHKCKGCHNKESWEASNGILFTPHMKDNLIKQLKRMKEPKITLSGGDPLYGMHRKEVILLCKELKEAVIDIWLYTGFTLQEITNFKYTNIVLDYIDVLVDGKFVKELKDDSCLFRGSSNQQIYRITRGVNGRIIKNCSEDFKA